MGPRAHDNSFARTKPDVVDAQTHGRLPTQMAASSAEDEGGIAMMTRQCHERIKMTIMTLILPR
eukprot:6638267-Pyramimonas_sp.AAC.1